MLKTSDIFVAILEELYLKCIYQLGDLWKQLFLFKASE